jgi:hypothetical protein
VKKLIDESDVLKIDDLLQFFDPNMEIETFKEKIFESLNSYNEEIEILKKDMENFSKTTEKI